ncbi:hypothetical protein GGF46_000684 [Coemansia sp. RSA 552]|nr:hypothetical protein GGF46_000684 [Coemansia sp. RSA 552]
MDAEMTAEGQQQQQQGIQEQDPAIAKLLQTVKDANALVDDEKDTHADSSHSDSSSSSSESDFDADMADDDDDSDDEGTGAQHMDDGDHGASQAVAATRHEVVNPAIPEPSISEVPDTTQLCALGVIHSVVGSSVTIQAHISGETHVLDAESVIAFEDRKVLGLVFDVFGPVTRPMYTVRFQTAEGIDLERCVVGRPVFYPLGLARMLATQKLRVKGTDASNEYDEEVGSDAMEFSDDEAERAFRKRRNNKNKMAGQGPRPTPPTNAGGGKQQQPPPPPPQQQQQQDAPASVAGRKLQSYADMYDPDYGF